MSPQDGEVLAEQLHGWYLEACRELNPESFNAKAQKDYADLSEEQKFLDRYIAKKVIQRELASRIAAFDRAIEIVTKEAAGHADPQRAREWYAAAIARVRDGVLNG